MMPWNLTVEAPGLRLTMTVEVEPSWSIGQMCAHLCSLNPSVLSLEEEYDIFIKPPKDQLLSRGQRLESSVSLSSAGNAILETKTLLLFQHAESTKVFVGSGENQVVLADLDPRWTVIEVIRYLVDLCKGQLPQLSNQQAASLSPEDYGLLVEPKRSSSIAKRRSTKKVYKRGGGNITPNTSSSDDLASLAVSASSSNIGPVISKPTWLADNDVLLATGWDAKQHRLRITLRPREVTVYLPPPQQQSLSPSPSLNVVTTTAAAAPSTTTATGASEGVEEGLSSSPKSTSPVVTVSEPTDEPKTSPKASEKDSSETKPDADQSEEKPTDATDTTVPLLDTKESKETKDSSPPITPTLSTNPPSSPSKAQPDGIASSSTTLKTQSKSNSKLSTTTSNKSRGSSVTSIVGSSSANSLATSPFTSATLVSSSSSTDGGVDLVIFLSFELPASTLIKEVLRLAGRDQTQAATYSLYSSSDNKLLSRRKTLAEAGISPGDKLHLKFELSSIKLLESEPRTRESMVIASYEDIERAGASFGSEGLGGSGISTGSSESPSSGALTSIASAAASSAASSGGVPDLGASSDNVESGDVDIYDEPKEPIGKYEKFEPSGVYAAATLNKLIMHLTDPDYYDKEFLECFLLTYRSFATPSLILQKLIQRYRAPNGRVPREKVDTIRVRVMVFLTNWLDKYFQELDERVIEQINIWAETEVDPDRRPILLKTLNVRPTPFLPMDLSFWLTRRLCFL